MAEFEGLKDEYSVDPNVVYFNSAGQSILPKSVEDKGVSGLRKKLQPWQGMGSDKDVDELRTLYATLINAPSPDHIAICPSTAFAMSLAAKNIVQMGVLHENSCVLLLEKEFTSSVYPWQEACSITGAQFKVVEGSTDPNFDWADEIIHQLDEDVAVLVLPAVHWCDGALINMEKIAGFLAQVPIEVRPFLIIDGTQSIGALPFDVAVIRPTFVACSTHKWLNGPMGASLMYVDESLHQIWEPLDHHSWGRVGCHLPEWEEVVYMSNESGYPVEFLPGARRLDAGGKAFNPITVPMVSEGLRLTLRWSPATVQARLSALTDLLVDKLTAALGSNILSIRPHAQRSGHILGIRLHRDLAAGVQDPATGELYTLSSLGAELKRNDIHVGIRGGVVRVSPYLYNTPSDVSRFVTAFVQIVLYRMLRHHPLPMHLDTAPPPVSINTDGSITRRGSASGMNGDGTASRRGSAGIASMGLGSSSRDAGDDASGKPPLGGGGGGSGSGSSNNSPLPNQSVNTMFPMPAKKITILMTGTAGWLGQIVSEAIVNSALHENFELFAGYDKSVPTWIIEEQRVHLDLTSRASIVAALDRVVPNVVIHLAALSSPVACDKDPERAMAVNCPAALAEEVKARLPDSLFLFASTDMVYDGETAPYNVISATKPVNVYGQTKLAFESHVTALRHGIVLRLSNMIGPAYVYRPVGCKFGQFLAEACGAGKFVSIRTDEVRSFVYVMDVLAVILRAIKMHYPAFKGESLAAAAAAATLAAAGGAPSTPFSPPSGKTLRKVGSFSTGSASAAAGGGGGGSNMNICTAGSCVRKILNVGGPNGLSRMQLAGVVARALGKNLKVVRAPSAEVAAAAVGASAEVWEVSASTAAEVSGGVVSPRDISMNSVMTENHLQLKFADMESIMRLCV